MPSKDTCWAGAKKVRIWQELRAHTSRYRRRRGCETSVNSCAVAGSDKKLTGIRLVDQTGADARKVGSYLSLFNSANRCGTERPCALAALVSFSTPLDQRHGYAAIFRGIASIRNGKGHCRRCCFHPQTHLWSMGGLLQSNAVTRFVPSTFLRWTTNVSKLSRLCALLHVKGAGLTDA